MRILHVSDTHGRFINLPKEGYDIIVHSGDILPNKTRGQMPFEAEWQQDWIQQNVERLFYWLGAGRVPVLIVSGNHDFVNLAFQLYEQPNWYDLDEITIKINGLKFFGYSYTPYFNGEWNGELTPEAEEACLELYKQEIEECDVLVPHGPLFGILDANAQGIHCGSEKLLHLLSSADILPMAILHGHIHEQGGSRVGWVSSKGNRTTIYNSATTYQLVDV